MNENFDKYRTLLVLNKAIMVVGEVNTGEDKPKIFPQEIMPLEDAPRRYTKQVHFRLHNAHLQPESLVRIQELVISHRGNCPFFLCFQQPAGGAVFVEAHERYRVAPSLKLQQAVDEQFGNGTYYVVVDTTPPERTPRRWENRNGGNSNGEE